MEVAIDVSTKLLQDCLSIVQNLDGEESSLCKYISLIVCVLYKFGGERGMVVQKLVGVKVCW